MEVMEFQKFTWKIQRELKNNRKPILLLFGNGYESQLLLATLHKLRKKFTIVHIRSDFINEQKVNKVIKRFSCRQPIILRPCFIKDYKKSWNRNHETTILTIEDLSIGFSIKDYLIMTGFKLDEPSLIKAWQKSCFDNLYCPMLRYPDDWIDVLYNDMTETENVGKFLKENLTSDS